MCDELNDHINTTFRACSHVVMNQEQRELVDRVLDSCPMLVRSSWSPVHRPRDDSDSSEARRRDTKFGGNKPFRPDNFWWPICDECNAHKAFVCQINIADLPPLLREHIKLSSGLFQLFYCLECMPLNCFKDVHIIKKADLVPSLQSFAAEEVVRRKIYYRKTLPSTLINYVEDYTENVPLHEVCGDKLEENVVEDWSMVSSELPNTQEFIDIETFAEEIKRKADINEAQFQTLVDLLSDEPDATLEPKGVTTARSGVKLGGWVRWCQGVEYPECPDCGITMDVTFLQLEEDAVYEFGWGDCGTGHVTLCPQCGRPGLQWACA